MKPRVRWKKEGASFSLFAPLEVGYQRTPGGERKISNGVNPSRRWAFGNKGQNCDGVRWVWGSGDRYLSATVAL
jgi:hypothetical protein